MNIYELVNEVIHGTDDELFHELLGCISIEDFAKAYTEIQQKTVIQ